MYTHKKHGTIIPTNWPILGTAPGILVNFQRLHDYATEILIQGHGTVVLKGPWLANMDMIFTADPLDIHHILSKNFNNYPKGDKFRKIFDALGDGILNADGRIWEISHKVIFSILKHEGFQSMMQTIVWDKVENGLLPILESICESGTEIDLQDIFQRFAYDNVCKLLLDNDPESLSLDFPHNPCLKAFTDGEEALLLRRFTPPWLWKLQQILKVGKEKKLSDAWKIVDQFIYKCLAQKQKEYNNMNHDAETFIFFTAIMRELKDHIGTFEDPTKFLRDTLVNLMAAGKDTISSALCWFFFMLARNPTVKDRILEEINTHLKINACKRWNTEDLDKMIYLHGALCESLRMESIWGVDCKEFKPERWISDSGGIKHEPSYKFPTFNAGPRACLGKNMALFQLKMVATTIIYHYHIQLVKDHPVLPAESMVLMMKHGLKVKLNKRDGLN